MVRTQPRVIDLRSDTVTKPTDEMREAMRNAEVGDDVYGEDPTVNRLERIAAERVGKEAAVFMPTGTMVNQAALWVHSKRQGALVCEEFSHIYYYESGGPALLSNLLVKTVKGTRGVFGPRDLEPVFLPEDDHYAPVTVVSIENTHNRAGGTCWTPTQTRSVADFAHAHNVPVHLDGARLFNAAIALGVGPEELAQHVDSVGFCLSKGLSAPVGSMLCGTNKFVSEARRVRKILGGGWRQAGVLAAAGIVALETMVDRLSEDHENARRLATGLSKIPGIRVDLETVQTNIIMLTAKEAGFASPDEFVDRLSQENVLCSPRDIGDEVRMVTNRHVTAKDVDAIIDAARSVVERKSAETTPRAKA
jgi:threonine aldolase